jgi:hypothetical protein
LLAPNPDADLSCHATYILDAIIAPLNACIAQVGRHEGAI